MNEVPQMASIADLRNSHTKVLELLQNGPVIINSRSKPVAVVVSPEQWNAPIQELGLLWAERETALSKWKLATGQSKRTRMSHEEVDQWLAEDDVDEPKTGLA